VKELINEFDPCGLIALEAPDDEYGCLTNQMVNMIIKGTSINEIKNLIVDEMKNHFGVDIRNDESYKS
jgi:flagellar motor component MotA